MDAGRRAFLKGVARGLAGAVPGGLMPHAMAERAAGTFDIRAFGAVGNGTEIDSPAVNRAIAAAADSGGGTVYIPSGTYACRSIRLRSRVALQLDPGAMLVAVSGGYDPAEPAAPWETYQDFGHNHWHNSLIWGENLHDVAILGQGRIWGQGLSRGEVAEAGLPPATAPGAADKAVALKSCRNVLLRDVSILAGGHFGILATAVDNLTLDNLLIDSNRDGVNIDCCRNVRVSGCRVNTPYDDGICLKSSYALGEARATENVTISDCYVTGNNRPGTLLDGTFQRFGPDLGAGLGQPTGRIKLGTESNGGFRNIAVANCVFEGCRGFALETVDGGAIEDITISGITMRDIRNAPFFLRLGARMRGPAGVPVGTLRRVLISNVTCDAPANDMPAIISGIPGHPVEDISFIDIYLMQKGGVAERMASAHPSEQERDYPEPDRFGPLPAQGFFIRHARNLTFSHVEIASEVADARPFFWLSDVDGADFFRIRLPPGHVAPAIAMEETRRIRVSGSPDVPDLAPSP